MNPTEKVKFQDDIEKIVNKGSFLGERLHKMLKTKSLRIITIALTILFGVAGFIYFFGKKLIQGK